MSALHHRQAARLHDKKSQLILSGAPATTKGLAFNVAASRSRTAAARNQARDSHLSRNRAPDLIHFILPANFAVRLKGSLIQNKRGGAWSPNAPIRIASLRFTTCMKANCSWWTNMRLARFGPLLTLHAASGFARSVRGVSRESTTRRTECDLSLLGRLPARTPHARCSPVDHT
jgi:hypothetical protein